MLVRMENAERDGADEDSTCEAGRLAALPSRLLARAAAISGRIVGDGLAAAGSHRYQYAVLATLAEFGPASQADLARRTGLDRSDMVPTIATLEAAGLVARAVDATDRRRNIVSLTGPGTARLAELDALVDRLQAEATAPLDADEATRLVALLGRLVRHHGGRWR